MQHVLSTGGGNALIDPADHQTALPQVVKDICVAELRANVTALAKLAAGAPHHRLQSSIGRFRLVGPKSVADPSPRNPTLALRKERGCPRRAYLEGALNGKNRS